MTSCNISNVLAMPCWNIAKVLPKMTQSKTHKQPSHVCIMFCILLKVCVTIKQPNINIIMINWSRNWQDINLKLTRTKI